MQAGIKNVVKRIKTREIPSIARITVLFEKDKKGKNSTN
jgi:plasmid replication initiation protein